MEENVQNHLNSDSVEWSSKFSHFHWIVKLRCERERENGNIPTIFILPLSFKHGRAPKIETVYPPSIHLQFAYALYAQCLVLMYVHKHHSIFYSFLSVLFSILLHYLSLSALCRWNEMRWDGFFTLYYKPYTILHTHYT